jgi:hypothetical protein
MSYLGTAFKYLVCTVVLIQYAASLVIIVKIPVLETTPSRRIVEVHENIVLIFSIVSLSSRGRNSDGHQVRGWASLQMVRKIGTPAGNRIPVIQPVVNTLIALVSHIT